MPVIISKRAAKQILKLPKRTQFKVAEAIALIPNHPDTAPVVTEPGTFRIKIYRYRIFYVTEPDAHVVTKVLPRGGSY